MSDRLEQRVRERYRGRDIPLRVQLPDGRAVALADRPKVDVVVRDWGTARTIAKPTMGALARAYVHDRIDFTGAARDVLSVAESLVGPLARDNGSLLASLRFWAHRMRGNKANISHHYDVSNAFYRMFLDERMVYSCAYFRGDDDSLELAQLQKLDHICRKLRLAPGERFLDIGCGWGALIVHAATHYGVRAKGITLSERQFEHVRARIAELGLGDRVSVELLDYLDLPEDAPFDKIASVGMFEHVGVANFPRYFGKIHRVLRPGGLVLNHGITHNAVGAGKLGSGMGDFVEEYVFPGGQLAHVCDVIRGMAEEGLEVFDAEALREHYARTLWHWVARLEANAEAARREVGEERFRVWRIYMAGSAYAFERGWLSLFQLLGGRALADGSLPKPLTREHLYRDVGMALAAANRSPPVAAPVRGSAERATSS